MNNKRSHIYLPIAFALVLIIGLFGGYRLNRFANNTGMGGIKGTPGSSVNLGELIQYINENYVDSVDTQKLNNDAISGMLFNLDPHSVYIPASDFSEANDALDGDFEGIGVQFRIERDSIVVISTIAGGPSAKVGIQAGDRIVKVDGKNTAGIKITNNQVMKLLKGPKGTKVETGIFRRGMKKLLTFSIIRDVIPTMSIDYVWPYNAAVGYVKISKFSATTKDELTEALDDLRNQGKTKLILDLRGNAGGYLQEAIAVADQFLPDGKMIVYTKGLHRSKREFRSTKAGFWDNLPVTVLIDEGSASASEIVAGAIQDNDRGTIVGRRSFGKGLVQQQLDLADGSAIRLTVERYYTPTGRCIQKPYDKGSDDYYMEYYHRMTDGELETADSVKLNDSLKYTTPKGKTVYGGGGIMPDVFVPVEKGAAVKYFTEVAAGGALYQFAFDYTDQNRKALGSYKNVADFNARFTVSDEIFNQLVAYASKSGVKATANEIALSRQRICNELKSYIGRELFGEAGFFSNFLIHDPAFLKALGVLNKEGK